MNMTREQLKAIIVEELEKLQERKVKIKSPKDEGIEEQAAPAGQNAFERELAGSDYGRQALKARDTRVAAASAPTATPAPAAASPVKPPTPAPAAASPVKPPTPAATPAKAPIKGAPIKPIKEQRPRRHQRHRAHSQRRGERPSGDRGRADDRGQSRRDGGGVSISLGDIFRGIGSAISARRQAGEEIPDVPEMPDVAAAEPDVTAMEPSVAAKDAAAPAGGKAIEAPPAPAGVAPTRRQSRQKARAARQAGRASARSIRAGEPQKIKEEQGSVFHACAAHVAMKESGEEGTPINHTLLEDGSVTHYVVEFKDRIVEDIPADALDVLEEKGHSHAYKRDDDNCDESKSRIKYETKDQNLFNRLSEAFIRR